MHTSHILSHRQLTNSGTLRFSLIIYIHVYMCTCICNFRDFLIRQKSTSAPSAAISSTSLTSIVSLAPLSLRGMEGQEPRTMTPTDGCARVSRGYCPRVCRATNSSGMALFLPSRCVTPTPAAPAQAYFLKADGSLDLAVGGGAAGAVGGPIFLGPSMNRFFWVLWHALALVF